MKHSPAVHKKTRKSRKYAKILGVRIDSASTSRVLAKVESNIKNRHKFYIVTPNPEIVMSVQEDEDLMNALNSAHISIPDGIGLVAADKFLDLPNPRGYLTRFIMLFAQGMGVGFSILFDKKWLGSDLKVIRGRELFLELVELADKKRWKIFLLGGEHGEALKTKSMLEKKYHKVTIKAEQGPMLFSDGVPKNTKEEKVEKLVIDKINDFSPELLFVCFDHRKQEKWLYRHYRLLNISGGMVLGGTFKYIAGIQKLPPKLVADNGLEWLWRLLTGSQKGRRIFMAFPKFPLKIFWTKYTK